MSMQLSPYLSFKGNTKEAMEFYKSVFGGEVELHTFKEYGASQDPNDDDKIMHSVINSDKGIMFFASDTSKVMNLKEGNNFAMSLTGDKEKELKDYFDKLSAGGEVLAPFEKAVWGDTFGMCNDKFGVRWLVNAAKPSN